MATAGPPPPSSAPLLAVLACVPGPEPTPLPALVARLDAQALVTEAARHGLSAWLADVFDAQGVALPADAARTLAAEARATVAAGARLKRLLGAVLDAFAREGLSPIALKGYGLASRLWPSPLARPGSDVDVLVRPDEVPRARRALEGLGLAEAKDPALDDPFEEHHHLAFHAPGKTVELHFRLSMTFGATFDDEGVQARAVPGTVDGRPVRWLALEDEFLYLAVHAATHAFMRVAWLLDLKLYLARTPGLDWATMGLRARRAGFTQAMAATLLLLERSLGVTLPAAAHAAFPLSRWRRPVLARVFAPPRLSAGSIAEDTWAGVGVRLLLTSGVRRVARQSVEGGLRLWRRRRSET